MAYTYRKFDPRDQLITDADTGAIQGIRSFQEQNMLNGVSDQMSGFVGSLTAVAGRIITIPASAQAMNSGGVTISSGSITCGGEFVCFAF